MEPGSLVASILLVVTGALFPTSADAIRELPSIADGIWLEFGTEFGFQGQVFSQALIENAYAPTHVVETVGYTMTPLLYVEEYESHLNTGFGFWAHVGHGGPVEPNLYVLAIENYCGTDDCRAARDYRCAQLLIGNVYSASEIRPVQYVDEVSGAVRSYGIGVTPTFIANYFYDWNSSVHISASFGYQAASTGFTGALSFLAPDFSPFADASELAMETFYSRMHGNEGVDRRSLGKAREGFESLWTHTGSDSVVFAPIVSEILDTEYPGDKCRHRVEVSFDCDMDTSVPAPAVFLAHDEVFSLFEAQWLDANTLILEIGEHVLGTFDYRLLADQSFSGGAIGLRANANFVSLDGNTTGNLGPDGPNLFGVNGLTPNRDYFRVLHTSDCDDDPAASLSYDLPFAEQDGVHVRWTTTLEENVGAFIVERSDSRFGPFEVVGSAAPIGQSDYEVVDPGSTDGGRVNKCVNGIRRRPSDSTS